MTSIRLFRVPLHRIKQFCIFLCTLFAYWLCGKLGLKPIPAEATVLPKGWMMVNPALADEIGINKAVIFQHIDGWVQHNLRRDKNIKAGRAWSYNTIPNWGSAFCWLNTNYVGKLIRELEQDGRLLSAKLAPHPSNQTKSYSTDAGTLPITDPQQMSLWPVENMTLRGRKVPHDSSIGTAKANPSKAQSKTPAPNARGRTYGIPYGHKPVNAAAVALFPNHIPDVEPAEKKTEIPERRLEADEHEPFTAIGGMPDEAKAENTPFIPRVSPCPAGDETTEAETVSSGAPPPLDVPEWVNIFTARDWEIDGWLKDDFDRLKAWCEYAPDHELGGGYVRVVMRGKQWPPQRKANGDWSNLTAEQFADIERNNEEVYQQLMARQAEGV